MIFFKDEVSKRCFVNKSDCWFHKLFVKLENWVPGTVNFDRLVWVSIVGVPLHAWNEGNFRKIG